MRFPPQPCLPARSGLWAGETQLGWRTRQTARGVLSEEAVNEVKRQAMSELQKAVSDAERKAHELISTERAKMERALAGVRGGRHPRGRPLTVVNQQGRTQRGRALPHPCS